MAIQTEIWARDIKEKLFPDNSWVTASVNDSMWVNNKVVHKPQAGALPNVQMDRGTVPANITKRPDSDNSYMLHEFTSDPTLIQDIEEVEVSYNKRSSVLMGHTKQLNLEIANFLQTQWAPTNAANIVRTSGANGDAHLAGTTGTRKKVTIADIMKMRSLLNEMDVDETGRKLLIPSSWYDQLLLDEMDVLMSKDFTGDAEIKQGRLTKLLGFDIVTRSTKNMLRYSNAATPVVQSFKTNVTGTMNLAALAWHPDFVSRALGAVKVFADNDKPEYYGSIFSTLARAGGQKEYTDQLGVVSLVEAAGA